jgi:phosphoesterase RecJ-like protein
MFEAVIEKLRAGRKLVLIHGNADPDAFGSAYALRRCFPDVDICAPQGLDRVTKVISRKLGYEPLGTADLFVYDTVLVVDTSSPEQLGEMNRPTPDWIVIDHHARSDKWASCQYYCDDTRRSCSELIFDLINESHVAPDKSAGLALLCGMTTDSGHFRYATPALLRSFGDLMAMTGTEMDEIFTMTDLEPDISERIAVMKGGQRLRFERVGERIVAVSLGSSFESSVCKSLLGMGADVAFVVSQRDETFRMSARARAEMVRAGLHLGKMLEDVGKETMNEGGGHPGAAGLTGIGDAEAIANICVSRTMSLFRTLNGRY